MRLGDAMRSIGPESRPKPHPESRHQSRRESRSECLPGSAPNDTDNRLVERESLKYYDRRVMRVSKFFLFYNYLLLVVHQTDEMKYLG
jgi:hypothetical protein